MSVITFQNRKYKVRYIEIEGEGTRLIASSALNKKLVSPEGSYTSKDAIDEDERIYFFVEPHILKLKYSELVQHVIKYCV